MKQDPFAAGRIQVVIPDLGTDGRPIRLVNWLVPTGASVIPGERLAELLAEGTVFQLEAPAEGRLSRRRAASGKLLAPGDVIATIAPVST